MKTDDLVRRLVKYASSIKMVDAHQHLAPEASVETDLCRMIIADNYILTDLTTAGLGAEQAKQISDMSVPFAKRWKMLFPYWEKVKFTTYAEAHAITLRDCYGLKKFDTESAAKASKRITEDFAKPGLYKRVLSERCGIDSVLNQWVAFDYEKPKFYQVARIVDAAWSLKPDGVFEKMAVKAGVKIKNVDDFIAGAEAIHRWHYAQGAIGFKIVAMPWREPTAAELKRSFMKCRHWKRRAPGDEWALAAKLYSATAKIAAELNVPVAVHTGAPWTNRLDFRTWEPTGLIPYLQAFPETKFDLYHAGIPYVTQFSMIGKAYPNVWLNLAWAHILSKELAKRAISEWLDMVPINKVFAFGGDYHGGTVALTYGHLQIARRNIAEVLAERIMAGGLAEGQAREIMRFWFSENPRELYRIGKR